MSDVTIIATPPAQNIVRDVEITPFHSPLPALSLVTADNVTIAGNGTTEDPLHTISGGGGDTFQRINITPRAPDPFGGGRMPTGYVADYNDPSMPAFSRYLWAGADNQGTWLTGVDATGFPDGTLLIFENMSSSGIDAGTVVLKDETSPEATIGAVASLAANRIVCPGGQDYVCPIFGLTLLVRGVNKDGDPRWLVRDVNGYAKKVIAQSLQLYPNVQVGTNGTPIAGTFNDWDPVSEDEGFGAGPGPVPQNIAGSNGLFKDHTLIRVLVDAAGATVTGFATSGLADARDWGPVKIVMNQGPGVLTFANLNAGSLIQNRLHCPNGIDLKVAPGSAVAFVFPYNFAPAGGTPQWWCLGASNEIFPSVTTGPLVYSDEKITPMATPAALPAVPAVTEDWDPGSTDKVIRVTTNPNGSILGGLIGKPPEDVTTIGEVRWLRNVGSGPLVLLDESPGSLIQHRFSLPGFTSFLIVPPIGAVQIQRDQTGFWVISNPTEVDTSSRPQNPITPAVLPVGDTNDWAPVDAVTGYPGKYTNWWRIQGSVGTVLTGIDAVTVPPGHNGARRILLTNFASGMTIANSRTSIATNQFFCPGGADYVLPAFGSVWCIYDFDTSKWFLESSHVGGG